MKRQVTQITTSKQAAIATRRFFAQFGWEQEALVVLYLDTNNRIVGRPEVVAVGTLNGVEIHPRDIFRHAVRRNALTLILTHCHPSGDPEPSTADRKMTQRLQEGCRLLGIPVLDHVIVTKRAHYSFADNGVL